MLVGAVTGLSLLAIVTPALAQAPSEVAVDGVTPSFALMDVDGERSKVEAEVGMGVTTKGASAQLWSGRLRAQIMLDPTFGFYGTLQGGGVTSSNSDFGMGSPEAGGLIHLRPSANTNVSFHAGVAVSLLNDDSLGGELAAAAARPSDLALVVGGTSWLRGGASAAFHDRSVFARLDLGFDQQIDAEDGDDNETLTHLNAGIGFGNQQWSAAAELQLLRVDGEHAETAGVSLHYRGKTAAPYLLITRPIGGDLFRDVITLSAGASFF
ncbi:MAG: hypothetical protein H7138_17595 [Myxococcales bacterium]|nr:hypothetical protein [Myxococcales bacterium]